MRPFRVPAMPASPVIPALPRHSRPHPSFPPARVIGATFVLRVPLLGRFNGKHKPASRSASTPVLLKPGEKRRLLKPVMPKPTSEPNPKPPRKVPPPKVKEPPEGRKEEEGPKPLRPKRREAHRKAARDWRERAKELGLCRDCREPAIPTQTRCEACAEKHRAAHRIYYAARRKRSSV